MKSICLAVCILLSFCAIIETREITEECRCMGARLWYWQQYADVANFGVDPVTHALAEPARAWNCDFCNPTYTGKPNVYINDSISRCDAAVQDYLKNYNTAGNPLTESTAWDHYWNNFLTDGSLMWNAQICPGVVPTNPRPYVNMEYKCTCMAARLDYWARYPDTVSIDPVSHYLSKYGSAEIREWDCSKCDVDAVYIEQAWSANCPAAIEDYKTKHRDAKTYADPFLAYYNYFLTVGNVNVWHGELCINDSTAYISTTTTGSVAPGTTGDSTPVATTGVSTPVATTGDSTPVATTGDSTPAATTGTKPQGATSGVIIKPTTGTNFDLDSSAISVQTFTLLSVFICVISVFIL
jgi:hypothetical protein